MVDKRGGMVDNPYANYIQVSSPEIIRSLATSKPIHRR